MAMVQDLERPQRSGEEIDLDRLMPWLQQHVPDISGTPSITQFSGGVSNWTYRLQFPTKDIILRRAPTGKKAAGAHNMPREYKIQKRLKPFFHYVPKMIAVCDDPSVLGSTFYLMERIDGIIPRKNFPGSHTWDQDLVRKLCYSFWDTLIELHQVDPEEVGLRTLGKGAGYIERQITGWNKRYADATTWNVPSGKKVMQWLEQNIPTEDRLCLIHNDFRLDNVVLNPNERSEIIGVLDWELATIGDPLMDLGCSMAYWVEAEDDFFIKSMRRQPSNVPGMLTRKEVITYYSQKTGKNIDDFRFYRVYGLFRLAGIIQQIYYRYSMGYTKNKAFKSFWMLSFYLVKTCENIIKQRK